VKEGSLAVVIARRNGTIALSISIWPLSWNSALLDPNLVSKSLQSHFGLEAKSKLIGCPASHGLG
jgi:hypothetical protein